MTTLDDVELTREDAVKLKATKHDINCVGIALSKCPATSQAKIIILSVADSGRLPGRA